jgi:hypothetical protein
VTVFGTIRTDDEIEDAVIATLRKWLPTYIAEVERQLGLDVGFYQRPFHSSYTVRTDFEVWPEEMMPVVSVEAFTIESDPRRNGRGIMTGQFATGITNICASNNAVYVRSYAARMGAAIRAAVMQHQSLDAQLDGSVQGVSFLGSTNNLLASQDDRTIRAYRQVFVVEVADILTRGAGPAAPDVDPPDDPNEPVPDWGTVETVVTTLEKLDE